MIGSRESVHYRYDALDQLVACVLSEQADTQRFYLKNRLATEIQDSMQCSIFQHEDQLLALRQRREDERILLAADQQRSVLNAVGNSRLYSRVYTPYGHRPPLEGYSNLLGFNGERVDPFTGHYLLGNGYRSFNPVLMRFNSPDRHSPFGEGGLNAYAYCLGDPVNREDSTGRSSVLVRFFSRLGNRANQFISGKPNTGPKLTVQNFEKIAPKITVFESFDGSKKQLNILAHSYARTKLSDGGMHLISPGMDGVRWTPEDLVNKLNGAGVLTSDHERINLIACYGADGGSRAFGQQVANITGRTTKSYVLTVSVDVTYVGDAMEWVRVNRDSKSAGVSGYKYKSAVFKPA